MIELKEKILGLSLEEATKIVEKEDYYIRVLSEDGRTNITNMDRRLDRINVIIMEGTVVRVSFG